MDNAYYASLARQSGLRQEMQLIAHNIANMTTDGFQREGIVFSEFVQDLENRDTSLSMARAHGRSIDRSQGPLERTGGSFDFAIEGEGYFLVETADGPALTRAGHFSVSPDGELVASDGARLLDGGRAAIAIPQGGREFALAPDGTLSVDGAPVAEIGVFRPLDPFSLSRRAGVRYTTDAGVEAVEAPRVIQGFLENSNVDAIVEVARMIEVQRAYERGKSLMDTEHERIRDVIRTLGQN